MSFCFIGALVYRICNCGEKKDQSETPTSTPAEKTPLNGVGNLYTSVAVKQSPSDMKNWENQTKTIEVQEASKISAV